MAKKVIVIEENRDILDLMQYILEDEGYEVISSVDGSVLGNIEQTDPALIVLDNSLTNEKGSSLCRKLKSNPSTAKYPIILVSAVNEIEDIAKECLADAYLSKPFDINELIAVVKQHIA
ncbi:response regulator [Mucilaginibacter sp.]|uniref:response regulator transcription factor n=1 Tax=Mucilaginibacter sp. TaxID=1882438 RepID=UPI0025F22940|nr:response regulator [Mucilaginibacter sp.]